MESVEKKLNEIEERANKMSNTFMFLKVIKYLIIGWALSVLLIVGGFLWYLNQYDFIGYSQDGSGYNNVNTGEQGDVNNGTKSEKQDQKKQ